MGNNDLVLVNAINTLGKRVSEVRQRVNKIEQRPDIFAGLSVDKMAAAARVAEAHGNASRNEKYEQALRDVREAHTYTATDDGLAVTNKSGQALTVPWEFVIAVTEHRNDTGFESVIEDANDNGAEGDLPDGMLVCATSLKGDGLVALQCGGFDEEAFWRFFDARTDKLTDKNSVVISAYDLEKAYRLAASDKHSRWRRGGLAPLSKKMILTEAFVRDHRARTVIKSKTQPAF